MMLLDWHNYQAAKKLQAEDAPFYGLIAAAMWRADTFNAMRLRAAFPEVWDDLQRRYDSPGGFLPEDPERLIRNVAGESADAILARLREGS